MLIKQPACEKTQKYRDHHIDAELAYHPQQLDSLAPVPSLFISAYSHT